MSDNINATNFKQLRREVQLLRDELAIMKRKYEDIIYNLDDDNFSSRFVKEKGDMRTAIEINAEGIKTKVSNEEFESAIKQTSDKIEASVSNINENLKNYSTITQTSEAIKSTVTKEYVDNLVGDTYVTNSVFTQTSNEIYAEVSSNYNDLDSQISSVSQTASSISTRVGKVEKGQYGSYTLFEQNDDTFLFDGDYMRISSAIILTDNAGNAAFSIFHNQSDSTVYMWGYSGSYEYSPVVIGNKSTTNTQPIYLYDRYSDDNLIATQGWVLANAGGSGGTATAVFG